MKSRKKREAKRLRVYDKPAFVIDGYARERHISFAQAGNEILSVGIKNLYDNIPVNLDKYVLESPIPKLDEYHDKRINGMTVMDAIKHDFLDESQIMGIYQTFNDLKDEFEPERKESKQTININKQQ